MTTISKFYLHDAATADAGTLPGATTVSLTSPTQTATEASTNRSMDAAIGPGQTSQAVSTTATKSTQGSWYRRFLSAPIAAQTFANNASYTYQVGYSQSNTNSAINSGNLCLAVWRPSTGAVVGRIYDSVNSTAGGNTTNTTQQVGGLGFSGAAVTSQDGDILVLEVWTANAQSMATSYTNTVFYDGTTESSTTNEAAFIEFTSAAVTMQSTAFVPRHPAINHQDPGLLFRRFWEGWTRKSSGVLVPG